MLYPNVHVSQWLPRVRMQGASCTLTNSNRIFILRQNSPKRFLCTEEPTLFTSFDRLSTEIAANPHGIHHGAQRVKALVQPEPESFCCHAELSKLCHFLIWLQTDVATYTICGIY